jgi:hypothetical protein
VHQATDAATSKVSRVGIMVSPHALARGKAIDGGDVWPTTIVFIIRRDRNRGRPWRDYGHRNDTLGTPLPEEYCEFAKSIGIPGRHAETLSASSAVQ